MLTILKPKALIGLSPSEVTLTLDLTRLQGFVVGPMVLVSGDQSMWLFIDPGRQREHGRCMVLSAMELS